jgi:hypothetical protein
LARCGSLRVVGFNLGWGSFRDLRTALKVNPLPLEALKELLGKAA